MKEIGDILGKIEVTVAKPSARATGREARATSGRSGCWMRPRRPRRRRLKSFTNTRY